MLTIIPQLNSNISDAISPPFFDHSFKISSLKSAGTMEKKESEICQRIQSLPDEKHHEKFLRDSMELILKKAVFGATKRSAKVLEFRSPKDLLQIMDLKIRDEGEDDEAVLKHMSDVIKYSVKIGHPYFMNQLYSSVDPFGLAGQWLTDALNPSVYTYEVSPVFTLMEEVVLKEMRRFVGWPDGKGDGIFCPGGSMSNGYAINCARYHAFPEIKTKGMHAIGPAVIYVSKDAHYSTTKFAEFQGFGSENVELIPTDTRGKLIPKELELAIKRSINAGKKPLVVVATAGTTVLGAFDPIEEIADICNQYKLWLHVDGAWGGGALMSRKHRHLLKGIERADSVTWNPHKLLCAPQQCSTMLTKHQDVLKNSNSYQASYLFQKDKCYDISYDTGDKHIQCGRRADVLKLWVMWKAKGSNGFEKHIDKVFSLSKYFRDQLLTKDGFELLIDEPECTNVSFWYIPPGLRGVKRDQLFKEKLNKVAATIKARMMAEGCCMITYQQMDNLPNFFRLVVQNSGLETSDMDHIIRIIQKLAQDL